MTDTYTEFYNQAHPLAKQFKSTGRFRGVRFCVTASNELCFDDHVTDNFIQEFNDYYFHKLVEEKQSASIR